MNDPIRWAQYRMVELKRVFAALEPLLNICANRAVGAPGTPGDVDDLIFVGHAIGRVYVAILDWSRRLRAANIPAGFRSVADTLAKFTDEATAEIEAYCPRSRQQIDEAIVLASTGVVAVVNLKLTLRLSDTLVEQFDRDLTAAAAGLARGKQ